MESSRQLTGSKQPLHRESSEGLCPADSADTRYRTLNLALHTSHANIYWKIISFTMAHLRSGHCQIKSKSHQTQSNFLVIHLRFEHFIWQQSVTLQAHRGNYIKKSYIDRWQGTNANIKTINNKYNSWACTERLYHGASGTLSLSFWLKKTGTSKIMIPPILSKLRVCWWQSWHGVTCLHVLSRVSLSGPDGECGHGDDLPGSDGPRAPSWDCGNHWQHPPHHHTSSYQVSSSVLNYFLHGKPKYFRPGLARSAHHFKRTMFGSLLLVPTNMDIVDQTKLFTQLDPFHEQFIPTPSINAGTYRKSISDY